MCELGHFFSFYLGAYLATKFPILMENSDRKGRGMAIGRMNAQDAGLVTSAERAESCA